MPIDLAQFHETFYEECFEAAAAMEEALLCLDVERWDGELIHTVFRAAHSIKGGAATFGFNAISSFTHSLEALLDGLRAERLQLTKPLAQLLLRSVDVLREMLSAQRAQQPINSQQAADLQFEMEVAAQQTAPALGPDERTAVASAAAAAVRCYHISFRPLPHLLARRNDPLRLFRELRALGELQVGVDVAELPPLHQLDPESCYLSWRLQLRSSAARESILEVFEWTEGDCTLDVSTVEEPAVIAPAPAGPVAAVPPTLHPTAAEPEARAAGVRGQANCAALARPADAASIRVSVEKIDQLMNSVSELVITQSMLAQLGARLEGAAGEGMRTGLEQLERHVRELQEHVMRVRMVPISFVFNRFARLVRDLSQRLGKQVELKITGSDTELDKSVLERIGDPLTHLVRNGVDHGIELPEQRCASGKPARGTIHLHAYHRGSSVRVEVSDDGAGLRRERILAKARERGLVGPSEQPSDEALCDLIFLAGFSTAERATLVSGRGVGMDVVKRNIEALGGRIELQSRSGQGTRFMITLPLTLAIVDGQTVALGEESYIVPLTAVVESLQMRTASVQQLVGRGEMLSFRGEYVPVVRLEQLFASVRRRERESRSEIIMVVEADGRRMGLVVDELLGQQQVVVKTLEANYGQVEGIAGATILGDGSVALILDIERLTRCLAERLAA